MTADRCLLLEPDGMVWMWLTGRLQVTPIEVASGHLTARPRSSVVPCSLPWTHPASSPVVRGPLLNAKDHGGHSAVFAFVGSRERLQRGTVLVKWPDGYEDMMKSA